jgi:hypothetical protein
LELRSDEGLSGDEEKLFDLSKKNEILMLLWLRIEVFGKTDIYFYGNVLQNRVEIEKSVDRLKVHMCFIGEIFTTRGY